MKDQILELMSSSWNGCQGKDSCSFMTVIWGVPEKWVRRYTYELQGENNGVYDSHIDSILDPSEQQELWQELKNFGNPQTKEDYKKFQLSIGLIMDDYVEVTYPSGQPEWYARDEAIPGGTTVEYRASWDALYDPEREPKTIVWQSPWDGRAWVGGLTAPKGGAIPYPMWLPNEINQRIKNNKRYYRTARVQVCGSRW